MERLSDQRVAAEEQQVEDEDFDSDRDVRSVELQGGLARGKGAEVRSFALRSAFALDRVDSCWKGRRA
eukprot:750308-Hanusia_phi.AAC.1